MPLVNTVISGTAGTTSSDDNAAKKYVGNAIINDIFLKINNVLSQDFTRVDQNTVEFDGYNGLVFRETYKLGDIAGKYLCVQISIPHNYINGYNDVTISFIITDDIVSSNETISWYDISIELTLTTNITGGTSTKDGVYYYSYYASYNFNLLTLKNDNFTLYTLSKGANNESFVKSVGECVIGNNIYFAYSNAEKTTRIFTLFDAEGNICYTGSLLICDCEGTNNSDVILTLPIYLCNGSNRISKLFTDLILETCLQVPSVSCSCGSTYKINDVEYFALGDNFLAKM